VLESKKVVSRGLPFALRWNIHTTRKLVQAINPAPESLKFLSEWEAEATKNPAAHGLSVQQIQDHVRYVLTFLFDVGYSLEHKQTSIS
jgi:hypothetical protein